MSLDIKISNLDTYIRVDYFGEYDFQTAYDVIGEIVDTCKKNNCSKVLFDFRNMKGAISTFERYKMAQYLVSTKPSNIQFVGIATDEQTSPVKIGEIFASAAGVNLKIIEDEIEAYRLLDIKPEGNK